MPVELKQLKNWVLLVPIRKDRSGQNAQSNRRDSAQAGATAAATTSASVRRSDVMHCNRQKECVQMPGKMARQTLERDAGACCAGSRPYLGSGLLGSPENRYNLPHFRVHPGNPGLRRSGLTEPIWAARHAAAGPCCGGGAAHGGYRVHSSESRVLRGNSCESQCSSAVGKGRTGRC
jgi:hypothetical protein